MSNPSADPPSTDTSSAEVDRERLAWRSRMLGGVSWAVVVAASFTTVWYLAVDQHMPKMMPALLGFTLLSVANAVGLRLPYLLRTGVLLASLFAIGAYAVAIGGFAPNAVLTLSVVTVTTTLLLGRSAGLVATLLGAGALFGAALAHRSGAVMRAPEWAAYIDSRDLANTMRVTAIFALLSGTLVIAVSYLLTRSEQLAVEKARSLARLEQEQGEKERIARDLELRDAAFRKAQELELLGRLAGSMAHDFNNSLLVIWSALDELTYLGPLPTAIEPALAAVRAAAEQAAATTKQLRAFGPTALQKSADLALGPVIAKTKTMLARLLPQNLELVVDVDLPVTISADEGEVLRVITNLALNARDAMRDGGKLTLRLRRPRDGEPKLANTGAAYVVLDVADTGSGMSDEVKARLFEPYFTTKQASGTGLGLASVRDALERAGGEAHVDSTLGQGTVISLFWPEVPSRREPAGATPPTASGRSAVVLVVDDERAVRYAIARGLTRAGMTVLEAEDGASALVMARRHKDKIDVLCTDCVMAGVPVSQLIQSFRELHGGKVIVSSGYAPTETGLSSEMFDDFLSKPFTGQDLVARIRALAG